MHIHRKSIEKQNENVTKRNETKSKSANEIEIETEAEAEASDDDRRKLADEFPEGKAPLEKLLCH